MPLLDIHDLQVEFGSGPQTTRAVDGVSLPLESGRVLGLVGESGSGKSVTALSIARLIPTPPARYVGGRILLEDRDVLTMSPSTLRQVRGGLVSYVFQEPGASLNPVFRIGTQIRESIRLHQPDASADAEVIRLLRLVGIPAPESRVRQFPHELSGGMQQRVMIAMALASQPRLLVADEPTTALDVTIQAQIIDLLRDLRQQLGMAILLITHNLGLVGDLADEVAVMYAGQIVEHGPVRDVLQHPLHPYTQALIQSVPRLDSELDRLTAIPGTVPAPHAFTTGCRFHPRCPLAQASCTRERPELISVDPHRRVRCPVTTASDSPSPSLHPS
jgi:oligopeptide/dipeptide ABC transporter ATP-binding protein